MAGAHSQAISHATERLIGTSPAIVVLRAQIQHLASFDAVGNPHVPTVLLQGETGTGKGLVARVLHDSGPRSPGPFVEVNCAAIPDTMLEAELFGFEPGAFTDAKRAKPGLFEAASGGTLFLDEIDALPLGLQGKLLTAIDTKQVRRLGAVTARTVDVKLIAATNAPLDQAIAAGRFRADLYHRLAVVVLALPPLRERGADVLLLAEAYLRQFAAAHGLPPKRLRVEAKAWLQGYAWPGNVRELSHVMDRVTLLHMGDEVDAATLSQLCFLPMAEGPARSPTFAPEPTSVSRLPAEVEAIQQALVQTGGNVARAARLLGISRDAIRYRMKRYGIGRPRAGLLAPAVPPHLPEGNLLGPPGPTPLSAQTETGLLPTSPAAPQDDNYEAGSAPPPSTPARVWEQKPVAVLTLEITWPEPSVIESPRYDPWTETARWEEAIVDKVQAFGGVLLQHTPALLLWVFGVPQTLEQLPLRAVHSALAIRQMVAEASASELVPRPSVRLAVHLGVVRVDSQAADPTSRLLPVGDTLVLPVRLLWQAAPDEIMISQEVGRLVDGWVALEARPLHWHAAEAAHRDGYSVIGVNPRPHPWAERQRSPSSPFVGRERELAVLDGVLDRVKNGQGQVVSLVG